MGKTIPPDDLQALLSAFPIPSKIEKPMAILFNFPAPAVLRNSKLVRIKGDAILSWHGPPGRLALAKEIAHGRMGTAYVANLINMVVAQHLK
ncbi:hypothetical protein D6833_08215, partial [Candidatus Parcubacteria bacterium]